jgi:hypothetical protein
MARSGHEVLSALWETHWNSKGAGAAMMSPEEELLKETNNLLRSLIGICTEIKFELVNERQRKERERTVTSTAIPEHHHLQNIDLGTAGIISIVVPDWEEK